MTGRQGGGLRATPDDSAYRLTDAVQYVYERQDEEATAQLWDEATAKAESGAAEIAARMGKGMGEFAELWGLRRTW